MLGLIGNAFKGCLSLIVIVIEVALLMFILSVLGMSVGFFTALFILVAIDLLIAIASSK